MTTTTTVASTSTGSTLATTPGDGCAAPLTPALGINAGDSDPTTALSCADNVAGGSDEQPSVPVSSGVTYFIWIDGSGSSEAGEGTLTAQLQ